LVGLSALVLLLVGDAAGRLRPYLSGTAVLGEMALAGVAGAVSVGLYGVLTLLLDLGQLGVPALLQATATAAVTNALLAPLVCRPVAALSRRLPVAQASAGTRGPGGNAW
nr:hypothetical protein [Euzebyales bacterium]